MNNVQKLAAMGCGEAILNSVIDRSNLNAAISNANTFLKYCKDGLKSGLFTQPSDCYTYIEKYYKRLLEIEHLANTYRELYGERFYKVKLSIEKLFTIN